jgi:DtxR family Mn-dependent transcriptional regulator
MQNQSTEDYVKGIYTLKKEGKSVATSALAKHLSIGDGSVTDMLKRLSGKNLIHYTPYQGVVLTESGERLAMKMMRRHRLWEMFLVKFLSYSWHEVHDEAERLEHVTSDELERRLDELLGFPTHDPHGDPIPSADGAMPALNHICLDECSPGGMQTIVRVSDESPELLRYLIEIGIELKKKIRILRRIEFDGSVIVRIGTREVTLSPQIARTIFVEA